MSPIPDNVAYLYAAYALIFGLVFLYLISLWLRERKLK